MTFKPGNDTYFEGILQLRDMTDAIEDLVKMRIDKDGLSISKVIKQKTGIDLFLSSQRKTLSIGRELRKHFGGEVKISRKLHTQDKQTTRNLYRVTVFYRPPSFAPGDCISSDGRILLITGVDDRAHGLDLESGRRASIPYVGKGIVILPKSQTTVCKVRPRIEVLHPETYQNVAVKNPRKIQVKPGEKVTVAVGETTIYMIK
ncbi:MAG: NMD3-related protein [archaeon]